MKMVVGFIKTPEGKAALDQAIEGTKGKDGHLKAGLKGPYTGPFVNRYGY
jgi:hypothetical protein